MRRWIKMHPWLQQISRVILKHTERFGATSGVNQVVIKLIKKTLTGTIDATTGGNVILTNGAEYRLLPMGWLMLTVSLIREM